MIYKFHSVRPSLLTALLCGVAAVSALAQDPAPPAAPGAPGPLTMPPQPPPQMQHAARPNPLFDALDTNHDGVLSAEEIANASVSLRALLKNGSDHLTRDDFRPAAPGRPEADPAGQPRPKIGAIRPHGPPPREDEGTPAQPEARRGHRPMPSDDQADEDSARPYGRREARREFRRSFRMDEDARDNEERPQPRHERPARHEDAPRPGDDEMDHDGPPRHPAPMREEREERPHHAPRPEFADDAHDGPPQAHGAMNEEGAFQPPHHQGPPPMPLFDALDANHDGTISAEEIANAPAALKALLKNGSDHLTRDDLRPAGPPPGER